MAVLSADIIHLVLFVFQVFTVASRYQERPSQMLRFGKQDLNNTDTRRSELILLSASAAERNSCSNCG